MTTRNDRAPQPGLDSREGLTVQVPVLSWNLTRERYPSDGSRQASRSVEAHPSRSYPRSTATTLAREVEDEGTVRVPESLGTEAREGYSTQDLLRGLIPNHFGGEGGVGVCLPGCSGDAFPAHQPTEMGRKKEDD